VAAAATDAAEAVLAAKATVSDMAKAATATVMATTGCDR
jgi:hypothetical protein